MRLRTQTSGCDNGIEVDVTDLVTVATVGHGLEGEVEPAVLFADDVDGEGASAHTKSFHLKLLVSVAAPLVVETRAAKGGLSEELAVPGHPNVHPDGIVSLEHFSDVSPARQKRVGQCLELGEAGNPPSNTDPSTRKGRLTGGRRSTKRENPTKRDYAAQTRWWLT